MNKNPLLILSTTIPVVLLMIGCATQQPTIQTGAGAEKVGDNLHKIDKSRVDPTAVRAHIERLHEENPKGGLVIQADRGSKNEQLMSVLNAARAAGLTQVAIATDT